MVPLDGADQLQVTPEVEMDVLTAVAWVPGRTDSFGDVFGAETPVQLRQDMRPLALLREITALLLRAETIRQVRALSGTPVDDRTAGEALAGEVALRSEWLEILGFASPPVPEDLADFLQAAPSAEIAPGRNADALFPQAAVRALAGHRP